MSPSHGAISAWRKSIRSGQEGNCVEVAGLGDATGIRDSKNPGAGHLTVSVAAFDTLLGRIKAGELDL
jgi:hypothetical protein